MKSLKFDHDLANFIEDGVLSTSLRLDDNKDLRVDDRLVVIDKVKPNDHNSWRAIGIATIDEIQEKRIKDINIEDLEKSKIYSDKTDLLKRFRIYYDHNIDQTTPIKIVHFSFEAYKDKRSMEDFDDKNTTPILEVKLYADGGSRGNPGPSASGYVVLDMHDNVIFEKGVYLGITTNNQAEYQALKLGLEELRNMHVKDAHIYMDSLLVINQILGKFKVKNRDLWPIHDDIKQQSKQFQSISFMHVPRELNKLADAMVNKALDDELRK